MASNWKEMSIRDTCIKSMTGGTPSSRNVDFYEGGTIPWLNTKEVDFCRIYKTENHITELGLQKSSAKWIPENSVIVAMYGATAGKVALNKIPLTTNQACCNLVIDNNKANYEFIYYYLSDSYLKLANLSNGAAQQNLNTSIINNFPILLPPLAEQKAIAHILGKLDNKIELNRQMNETLEAMAQALFKSWFVDFDPVIDNALLAGNDIPEPLKERAELRQAQLDSGKAKTNSEINDLFPSEFEFTEELGWTPLGWSVKSFSHLANLDTTSVKPSLEPEKIWEHYSIPAFDVDESPVFDLGETIKSNKYKVDKNAILVSKLNPETERIWWVDIGDEDSAICSTEFMQFIPKKVGYRGYIYNLVRSYPFQVEILSRVTGSTGSRQRAQPKSVAEIAVVIPNTELIDKFSEISDNLKSKVSGNISQNTKLAKLRDTLLPKLMSGDLRIPDAEKLAENI